MGDNTLSALRTQLVRLIINQGTIFSNWIKFAITVQGALAAGLGFALTDAKYRSLSDLLDTIQHLEACGVDFARKRTRG